VSVLSPDAELGQQALGVLERAGVEPSLDLGVKWVVERAQLVLAESSESASLASTCSD
jgi:hypothetical protein